MLTEDQIEKVIQPVIKRQERISLEVLRRFGVKIKEIKEIDPKDFTTLIQVRSSKIDATKLKKDVDRLFREQLEEILFILAWVALDSYNDSEYLYTNTNTPMPAFDENVGVQNATDSVIDQTRELFQTLFNRPGFIIRDLQNPQILKPTSIEDTYQTIVDEAVQSTQNTAIDYDVNMQRTEQQIINSGLNGIYTDSSGKVFTQRLDAAVRNNLLDGISLVQQMVQDEIGVQVGATGKELSAHRFSAPDHEPFQGHQFTNENWEKLQSSLDFEDVNGQQFMGVERIIGVWNCRHFAWSILVGQTKPMYSQMELNQFIDLNNVGYTLPNGKHLTMYECTQRQRQYEYRIRQAREGLYFANVIKSEKLQEKYKALVANRVNLYEAFCKDSGLSADLNRTKILQNN